MSDWMPGPAWLFCPADRPERYRKALDRSDVVILDLEDAVAPDSKQAARDALLRLAAAGELDIERTVVRVNAAGTEDHVADLVTVETTGLTRVMLAKAEDLRDVRAVDAEVIPLIETPQGAEWASCLAESPNVIGLLWGAEDLVAGLGGTSSRYPDGRYRDVVRYVRSRVLLAAKACDRFALDAVYLDIADHDGLHEECLDAVAVGFDATVAIHPSQVPVIRAAYAPPVSAVDWAMRLLDAVDGGGGVTTFEGRMVDGPVFRQAERILTRASTCGGGVTDDLSSDLSVR